MTYEKICESLSAELFPLREQFAVVTDDRDTLRAQLDAVTLERDAYQQACTSTLASQLSDIAKERDELRAVVKAVRVAYGNAPGRCGASDAPYHNLRYAINAALNSKVCK